MFKYVEDIDGIHLSAVAKEIPILLKLAGRISNWSKAYSNNSICSSFYQSHSFLQVNFISRIARSSLKINPLCTKRGISRDNQMSTRTPLCSKARTPNKTFAISLNFLQSYGNNIGYLAQETWFAPSYLNVSDVLCYVDKHHNN